jgi:phosphate transport system permease protein
VTVHTAAPAVRQRRRTAGRSDRIVRLALTAASAVVIVAIAGTLLFLVTESLPAMRHYGFLSFLHSTRWAPSEATVDASTPNPYGIVQFIYGTVLTSLIAMLIAVPVAIAVALFITDFAPARLRRPLSSLVDLLAAVPSVVYGFWGIFAFIPAIRPVVGAIDGSVGKLPVIGKVFAGPFFGVSYFTAGLILAIMILPIVAAVCREVFRTVPVAQKEAAYALGATKWEMVRVAILPRSRSGIVGASILGLGRAFGETIAVTMVIGNSVLAISTSVFGQGATMASVMANEFTEATEPFHLEALFVVAFWLLISSVAVNALARLIVKRNVAL